MGALNTLVRKVIPIILLKWHGIGLSLVSILYGFRLILNYHVLNYEMIYEKLSQVIDLRIIAAAFILAGIIKLLGIAFNQRQLRVIGVISLAVLWTVMSAAYLPTPNTIAILAIGYAWTAYGILIREDFH
ncbi:hypothetical protein EC55P2_00074 [Enterococcus phage EC55P2]|nr:hypothetical protein EC55P2_00074 [Enterococcus phage EC55P2]